MFSNKLEDRVETKAALKVVSTGVQCSLIHSKIEKASLGVQLQFFIPKGIPYVSYALATT